MLSGAFALLVFLSSVRREQGCCSGTFLQDSIHLAFLSFKEIKVTVAILAAYIQVASQVGLNLHWLGLFETELDKAIENMPWGTILHWQGLFFF